MASKGWNLIQRFSEDIDIFLAPTAFEPTLGKKAIDRELKTLRQAIEQHPGLQFVERESQTIGGFGRNELCAERCPVSTSRTASSHRRWLRGAMPGTLLRIVPNLGRGTGAPGGNSRGAVTACRKGELSWAASRGPARFRINPEPTLHFAAVEEADYDIVLPLVDEIDPVPVDLHSADAIAGRTGQTRRELSRDAGRRARQTDRRQHTQIQQRSHND